MSLRIARAGFPARLTSLAIGALGLAACNAAEAHCPLDRRSDFEHFEKRARLEDEDRTTRTENALRKRAQDEELARNAAADEEQAADLAMQDKRRREALRHYLKAIELLPAGVACDTEQRLREKTIALVRSLDPPPAIPATAYEAFESADTIMEQASEPDDFRRAALEYQRGLKIAPWFGRAYGNLAVCEELLGDSAVALQELRLFARADPESFSSFNGSQWVRRLEAIGSAPSPFDLLGEWECDSDGGTCPARVRVVLRNGDLLGLDPSSNACIFRLHVMGQLLLGQYYEPIGSGKCIPCPVEGRSSAGQATLVATRFGFTQSESGLEVDREGFTIELERPPLR